MFSLLLKDLISDIYFIEGRFIGDNTRLMYDLLQNILGLLLLIDFEKAFDSLSVSFINNFSILDLQL